jgi:hypothetical protein
MQKILRSDRRKCQTLFEPCFTDVFHDELCKPFLQKEIGDALFQIGPLKAPGPDGLPARFFSEEPGLPKGGCHLCSEALF